MIKFLLNVVTQSYIVFQTNPTHQSGKVMTQIKVEDRTPMSAKGIAATHLGKLCTCKLQQCVSYHTKHH